MSYSTSPDGTRSGILAATPCRVYGDSYDVTPPLISSTGSEWFTRLKNQLGLASLSTYAVSGNWSIQNAIFALGNNPGSGSGFQTPPAGSTFPGNFRGLAILGTTVNDYAGITDRAATPVVTVALTANALNGLVQSLKTWLALATSASRVEIETGVLTGAWTTSTNGAASAGSSRYTSTPGDRADINITIPAAGYVWLSTLAGDPASTVPAAPFTWALDGGAATTVTGAVIQCQTYRESGLSNITYAPMVIKITGTPGVHALRVTHAGTAAQYLFLDTIITPSATPAVALVRQDTVPLAGGIWTAADITNIAANKTLVDPAFASVIAGFPSAFFVPSGLVTSGLSSSDKLHPNDYGQGQIAQAMQAFILNTVIPAALPGLVPIT